MKRFFKATFNSENNSSRATAAVVKIVLNHSGKDSCHVSVNALRFPGAPIFFGPSFFYKKSGRFKMECNLLDKNFRFAYKTKFLVHGTGMPLQLTFRHTRDFSRYSSNFLLKNKTILDGTLELAPFHKISAEYIFDDGHFGLKLARGFKSDYSLKVFLGISSDTVGMEWCQKSEIYGCYKISARFNGNELANPKFMAEWSCDM